MKTDYTPVNLKTFPADLNTSLKVLAALEGTSKQQLIVDILNEYVAEHLNK